ncbi:hypothetical protein NDU88_004272 [Pleurodeles waltl]|uniref:Retrotransposon gag domain-containing protein n=1 Tax=Pleurodeles waltl TaxID=8319 RepID=A0AAV7QEA9_PLEWA|nr:hypothetical protein NDU88_004272 [Pleurodeles waltl]
MVWEDWRESFETSLEAVEGITSETSRKLALLKHCLGIEGRKVLKTLPEATPSVTTSHEGDGDEVLEAGDILSDVQVNAMKALEDNYGKKTIIVVERHKLFSRSQLPGKSVEQYVSALRTVAVICKFKDLHEEIVRDQFINRTSNNKIQEKLLELKDPLFQKAINIARSIENMPRYVKLLNDEHGQKKMAMGKQM